MHDDSIYVHPREDISCEMKNYQVRGCGWGEDTAGGGGGGVAGSIDILGRLTQRTCKMTKLSESIVSYCKMFFF